MASHGAAKEVAATAPTAPRKQPKVLSHGELREAENGGVTLEHHFTNYEHKPEVHVFGDGDGHKLAAHIEKHFGIKMPGKSAVESAAPHEGDENEE